MFKNVKGVMDAAGTDTSRVLKTTVRIRLCFPNSRIDALHTLQVFLASMDDFAAFNKHYAEFFAPYKVRHSLARRASER